MTSDESKTESEQSPSVEVALDPQGRPTSVRGITEPFELAVTYDDRRDTVRLSIAYRAPDGHFDAAMGYHLLNHSAYVAVGCGPEWVTLSFDNLAVSEMDTSHLCLVYRTQALAFVADHHRQRLKGLVGPQLRQWQHEWRRSGIVETLDVAMLRTITVPNVPLTELALLMRALAHAGMRPEVGEPTPYAGFLDATTLMTALHERLRLLFFPQIFAQQAGVAPVGSTALPVGAPPGSVAMPGLKPPPPPAGWGSVMTGLVPKGCTGWWTVARSSTPCWRIAAFSPPTTWGRGGAGGIPGKGLDAAIGAMYGAKVSMVRTFPSITYEQVVDITLTVHWFCPGTCWNSEDSTNLEYAQVIGTTTVNNVVESGTGRQNPTLGVAGAAMAPSAGQAPIPNVCNATPPHPTPLCQ
jgi:hypothetical protein